MLELCPVHILHVRHALTRRDTSIEDAMDNVVKKRIILLPITCFMYNRYYIVLKEYKQKYGYIKTCV